MKSTSDFTFGKRAQSFISKKNRDVIGRLNSQKELNMKTFSLFGSNFFLVLHYYGKGRP
jgi:hypothetical protein